MFLGQTSGEETAPEKAPEQLFNVVLRMFLSPSRRNRPRVDDTLHSDQFATSEFFEREHGKVKGYVRMPSIDDSTGRFQQRLGVLDAGLHRRRSVIGGLNRRSHQ
jgi:hypothetical protein